MIYSEHYDIPDINVLKEIIRNAYESFGIDEKDWLFLFCIKIKGEKIG